jgi:hypothetical protein
LAAAEVEGGDGVVEGGQVEQPAGEGHRRFGGEAVGGPEHKASGVDVQGESSEGTVESGDAGGDGGGAEAKVSGDSASLKRIGGRSKGTGTRKEAAANQGECSHGVSKGTQR